MILKKYSKIPAKVKGWLFLFKVHLILYPFSNLLFFLGNISRLSLWISKYKKNGYNTFYDLNFNYDARFNLHEHIISSENIETINYLEFGVFDGASFLWWADRIKNVESKFYGFDTFEGLPEDWGAFKSGEMLSGIPKTNDVRCEFVKGLFQNTLYNFLRTFDNSKKLVIHMDADLFSSTLFVLTTLAPFLKKDDIIMFDEFNVPNHEFFAFDIFVKSYYIKYDVLGAVNNFYQTAIKIM